MFRYKHKFDVFCPNLYIFLTFPHPVPSDIWLGGSWVGGARFFSGFSLEFVFAEKIEFS